jgi:bifunctional non-homologous end joining protein LigD
MRLLRWVKPRVVAEVSFAEWTRDGSLRHAAFIGLRDDKAPKDVRRESPP